MSRVDAAELESFATEVLRTSGTSEETAEAVARSLVESDLRGHTSHGVLRLPYYLELVDEEVIDPTSTPEVSSDDGTTARIDGRNAFGQLVGRELSAQLVARAAEYGVTAVGVRDATHLGRVGEWAERVASEGFAVFGFVNSQGGGQRVAPAGSSDRLLSTNPLVVGLPSFGALPHDVVLDMATSQVAHGKLRERRHTGESIPEGWAVDDDGSHVREIESFYANEGAIRPLGGAVSGYKGFGLAVVAELVAGCFGAGDVAGMATPAYSNNAAGFLAVDLERFLPQSAVAQRVSALAAHLDDAGTDAVPTGAGSKADQPRMPGALEHEQLVKNREAGVPIDDRVATALWELGDRFDITPPVTREE